MKIGVVPVKRGPGFTSTENALIPKNNAFKALENLGEFAEFINIDNIVPDGIAVSPGQVKDITNFLKSKNVDAVFIIHTDFGSEEVVARVGKEMGLPLLLWGERDDAPINGVRIRDTQCGLFASSKVLSRFGVPFTYIENCLAADAMFAKGVEDFCRVASVLKTFKNLRILKIGDRPASFFSVMGSEEELLSKFGIEIVPLALGQLYSRVNAMKNNEEVSAYAESMKKRMDTNLLGEEKLKILAAMVLYIKNQMTATGSKAASLECWSSMGDLFGFVPCQVIGELTAMGFPVSCEGDICGAVTSALLQAADFYKSPTFFADLTIRHPSNDNAELLWHCGPFPYALIKDGEKASLDEGGRGQWRLKNGELTIARFDSINGEYSMFVGTGSTIDGPAVSGTYVWLEVDDWLKWERTFIEGPYIHHTSVIYGNYSNILQEVCKYIKIKADVIA